VTRPEPRNDRRNTRKTFSLSNETSTHKYLQSININHPFLRKVLATGVLERIFHEFHEMSGLEKKNGDYPDNPHS
jgi:hypothetical protein